MVRYDPAVPEVFVVSGWGTRSDWYRNLRAHPRPRGADRQEAVPAPRQRFLDPGERLLLLADYRAAHPRAWRRIAPILGLPLDPQQAEERLRDIPAVAFSPAQPTG